jgi:hypothetical protein
VVFAPPVPGRAVNRSLNHVNLPLDPAAEVGFA